MGIAALIAPKKSALALAARGYRVVRFDNRDCGLSALAQATGAEMLVIEGMGHDFPEVLMLRLATPIADHCDKIVVVPQTVAT